MEFTEESWCWQWSEMTNEPLWGTATAEVGVWLALEYRGRWGAQAVAEAELPVAVRAHLERVKGGKLLLIRQPGRQHVEQIRFYVGIGGERLYRFDLESYEGVLGLEWDKILAGGEAYERYRQVTPLHLVCTNGQRDRCCAQKGTAVYLALQQQIATKQQAGDVWQVTHLGGHRWAATTLCLPAGRMYGRLDVASCEAYWLAVAAGEIPLAHDRGLTGWPAAAQVAEWHVREALGETREGGWQVEEIDGDETVYQVKLKHVMAGKSYRATVRLVKMVERYMSCQKLKTKVAPLYQFEGYKEVS